MRAPATTVCEPAIDLLRTSINIYKYISPPPPISHLFCLLSLPAPETFLSLFPFFFSLEDACWFNKATGVGAGCDRGMNENYFNFAVAPQGMLSWALGMLPYKDSFFSSATEKNTAPCMTCLFSNWSEPYPVVHALASALSAGPVAPGDGVGQANRTLIMQSCREDGLLLKPSRPATPVDAYWTQRAFGPAYASHLQPHTKKKRKKERGEKKQINSKQKGKKAKSKKANAILTCAYI
jgi:hypothetical protein